MEYLSKIDPSLKWLSLYIDAKKNGNIKFVTDQSKKWETYRQDGTNYLIAPLTNTLEDVSSMIHEFTHYITILNINQGEQVSLTLGEFPSLFFEDDLCDFLLTKGFSTQEINLLKERRLNWTLEDSLVVLPYLYYLAEYQDQGELTKAFLPKRINEKDRNIKKQRRKISQVDGKIPEKAQQIEKEYYERNLFLVQKSTEARKRYPYVIGMYLSNIARIRQGVERDVIPDMIQYTENLGTISPETVFARFEIDKKEEEKNFQKKKEKD